MGWTVYFKGEWAKPLEAEGMRRFREHIIKYGKRMSPESEGYNPELAPDRTGVTGFCKIAGVPDPASDYLCIVAAMRELASFIPDAEIFVHDDYYLQPTPLAEIDDAELRARIEDSGSPRVNAERRAAYREDVAERVRAILAEPEYKNLSPAARKLLEQRIADDLTLEADPRPGDGDEDEG
jgi:hypothetical protein